MMQRRRGSTPNATYVLPMNDTEGSRRCSAARTFLASAGLLTTLTSYRRSRTESHRLPQPPVAAHRACKRRAGLLTRPRLALFCDKMGAPSHLCNSSWPGAERRTLSCNVEQV